MHELYFLFVHSWQLISVFIHQLYTEATDAYAERVLIE